MGLETLVFGGIKRNVTDDLFSDLIREKANWRCENCRRDFSNQREILDCAHFITRGNKRTRWDFDNCLSLCRGCHIQFTKNPLEHYEFMKKKLGESGINLLRIRSQRQLTDGKIDEKAIRMGLKIELKRLRGEKILGIKS